MLKTIVITLFSLCFMGFVLCWISGVLPFGNTARGQLDRRFRHQAQTAGATEDGMTVYFSPNGGCTDAIVREIGKAKDCIYVQAAQFTFSPIARALVSARNRGIDVKVVIDASKNDGDKSEADRLVSGKVPTYSDAQHHTAHNKVIIIDHRLIFTGSFNLTRESETENAENLLMIEDKPKLVAAYEANFKEHLSHSTKFEK